MKSVTILINKNDIQSLKQFCELKEMQQKQNSKAIISFTFNGKTYKDKASFMETDKKTFSIGSSLIAVRLRAVASEWPHFLRPSSPHALFSGDLPNLVLTARTLTKPVLIFLGNEQKQGVYKIRNCELQRCADE